MSGGCAVAAFNFPQNEKANYDRVFDLERFVKRHRKKINTKVWFSLGSCLEIFREGGKKPSWLNRFMEKNNFKKMVSKYNEDMEKM